MPLDVAAPTLSQADAVDGAFSAAKPIDLLCPAPATPDGTPVLPPDSTRSVYRLFRRSGATDEVWDAEAKGWLPASERPKAEELFPKDGGWAGLIIAIGQPDSSGRERVVTDPASGDPSYFVRCEFAGRDASGQEHAGESPPSDAVKVLALGQDHRAGLRMEPEKPQEAQEIRVFLSDSPGGPERGRLAIRDAGGIECVLEAAGAQVAIRPDGEIVLEPAAGKRVRVAGPLRVEGAITASGNVQDNV